MLNGVRAVVIGVAIIGAFAMVAALTGCDQEVPPEKRIEMATRNCVYHYNSIPYWMRDDSVAITENCWHKAEAWYAERYGDG